MEARVQRTVARYAELLKLHTRETRGRGRFAGHGVETREEVVGELLVLLVTRAAVEQCGELGRLVRREHHRASEQRPLSRSTWVPDGYLTAHVDTG